MALAQTDNPAELFDPGGNPTLPPHEQIFSIHSRTKEWTVVQTKTRQEKALAHYAQTHGIPYFLPYARSWTSHPRNGNRRTRQRVLLPLFPGFIFTAEPPHLANYSRDVLKLSHRVLTFLAAQDQPRLTRELAAIASTPAEHRLLPHATIRKGTPVLVTEGPFRNMEGHVGRTTVLSPEDEKVRLVIDVYLMGRSVAVDILRSDLTFLPLPYEKPQKDPPSKHPYQRGL